MALKQRRFWDATVLAAAISAVAGGIFASAIAVLQGDRDAAQIELQARMTASKDRCDHAYSILADESLNRALSAQAADKLIADELNVANRCRTER